jgi:hypothetical protein
MRDRDLWRISLGCYFLDLLVDFEFSRNLKTTKFFFENFYIHVLKNFFFIIINLYIHVLHILYWATLMYPKMKILAAIDSNCMDMSSKDL